MGVQGDGERDWRPAFVKWAIEVFGPLSGENIAQLQHIWDNGFKCKCQINLNGYEYDDCFEFEPCKAFRDDYERIFRETHDGMDQAEWFAFKHRRLQELEHETRMLEDEQYRAAHLGGKLP